jgi:RNA polymerase sigma factor (TIGR02999 family)
VEACSAQIHAIRSPSPTSQSRILCAFPTACQVRSYDASVRPPDPLPDVTRMLADVRAGVPDAGSRLLDVVYGELRRLARARMAPAGDAHTLQPTALVHEVWVRLVGARDEQPEYRDREHFFAAAAAAMRSILVDHARRRAAHKRGGAQVHVTLHPDVAEDRVFDDVLAVHDALERLASSHERPARVVDLLFFAGLSPREAADVLGVSDRTVERDWRFGRAWLLKAME